MYNYYRVVTDHEDKPRTFSITEEGAKVIHDAYSKKWEQKFERFWGRGGTSVKEISLFRDMGLLPKNFSWSPYITKEIK